MRVTVLYPCLNEAQTVKLCVRAGLAALRAAGVEGEVLIADNGSVDGSQALASAAGARVIAATPRGYGAALRSGIDAAHGELVLMADCDGSYDVGDLPRFLDALGDADLVMGCRFPAGGGTITPGAMPWSHRWIGNPALSWLGRKTSGATITDFHCGIRLFRRESVRALGLRADGMEFATEMLLQASAAGLRMVEIPVTLRPDGRGRPPHLRTVRDGLRHTSLMLHHAVRRRR